MPFYPDNLKDWIDVFSKVFLTVFAISGGTLALLQYLRDSRLKIAETLLKVEEEFRNIFPTYEEIDIGYELHIKPVLVAKRENKLDHVGLTKMTQIDRCIRFLFICSVLNKELGVDRVLLLRFGALTKAYYYYMGILLPEVSAESRPELLAYTNHYYPRLTQWIEDHKCELKEVRDHRLSSSPKKTTKR